VLIDDVTQDGTAAAAKVTPQSLLLEVDGKPVLLPAEVASRQKDKTEVTYTILTGKDLKEKRTVTVPVKNGVTGIVLTPFPRELSAPRRSLPAAISLSFRETKLVTVQTVIGMSQLVTSLAKSGTVPPGVTGIVGIAQLTYASVQQGFMTYLRLIALLSLSLAILNILPFPALDGGRLMFVLVEALLQRPNNRRFELMTNMAGFIVLILLIVIITFYDILRLF
ncbi:MAG: rane-associated zinc metalloprotease, partial [Candidatus Peribacteria bacterium]|nr:rane-associated zinc metalloprotease [Candidatus Peribacteria bacterium]